MSHASECTATRPSQSFFCMPSRAKLMPRAGSGTSAGTSCKEGVERRGGERQPKGLVQDGDWRG